MKCEVCGSTNLIKENGEFVCKGCGMKYSLDEIRKMNDSASSKKVSIAKPAYSNSSSTSTSGSSTISTIPDYGSLASASPTHPEVKTKLVKTAKVFAVLAIILRFLVTIVYACNLSFVPPIFYFIFICFAAGAVFSIKNGTRGSDAVKRIPTVFLAYSVYSFFYLGIIANIRNIDIYTIIPAVWVLLMILLLVFMKKELPDGKLIKTKVVAIIAVVYSFGLSDTIGYILQKATATEKDKYYQVAYYGTNPINSFFMRAKSFLTFLKHPTEDFFNDAAYFAANLVELFILIALVLLLFAISKGDVEKSSDTEVKQNSDMFKISMAFGGVLVAMVLVGGWLGSLGGESSSGGKIDGYCQFDGCNKKAVGPTYEFCEYHKKMLNNIWELEEAQKRRGN